MTKIFAFLSVLYVIVLIFFCEFTVKTTEHTFSSYESSYDAAKQVFIQEIKSVLFF
jgi:hypothetical protein